MNELKAHPAADAFPMMTGDDFADLKRSISERGLRQPIVLLDGQIVDGRNRYRACIELGIDPETITYSSDESPWLYVWDENAERRHLQQGTKAAIWLDIEEGDAAFHAETERIKKEANTARSEAAKGQARSEDGKRFASGSCSETTTTRSKEAKTRKARAERSGTSPGDMAKAETLKNNAADLHKKVTDGKSSLHAAYKEYRARKLQAERNEIAAKAAQIDPSAMFRVDCCDLSKYTPPEPVDVIITDPPYPREFLPLFSTLAKKANEWLKDDGHLVIMSGQAYLDKVYAMLSEQLEYYWTACYHTPGQPTPLRQVNVNTTWKPLLIYKKHGAKYKGRIFGDFCVSGGNDKDFHKWGQSVSGMDGILERFALPGQSVLDPFCGAGTTGVSAIRRGCLFYGCDIVDENVQISISRITQELK